MRVLHVLRPYRLALLLAVFGALLAINALGSAKLPGRPQAFGPTGDCPANDPARHHFTLPVPEVTPPPGRPETAGSTWVGFAKPMAVDFTSAVLRGNEEQARVFVAPDYTLDISELRRYLGIVCQPDQFTARWVMVGSNQAVIEPTLYYVDSMVTFTITFKPYTDQWRIVTVEPQAGVRSAPS